MKSAQYWEERALAREAQSRLLADKALRDKTFRAYSRAQQQIQQDAERIFRTFMREGEITTAQANKLLSARESQDILDQLRKRVDSIADPKIRRRALNRLEAPAYAARISRLDALHNRISVEMAKVADAEQKAITGTLRKVYSDTYYRHIFDTQIGTGYAFDFAMLPEKAIQQVVRESYLGAHYSARVWHNTDMLARTAYDVLSKGIPSGMSIPRMASELDAVMQDGRYVATRLIRTEANRAYNAAELEADREEGVTKYRYIATLDKRTCSRCGALDRKVIPVAEAIEGVNYPPLHPNDRCTTAPVVDGVTLDGLKRRARNPETGKTMLVPADMSWEEWTNTYNKANLPKVKMAANTTMQDTFLAQQGGSKLLLPQGAQISSVRTIAGRGSAVEIRAAGSMVEKYGGDQWKWEKKVGIIESQHFKYDVHWYEYDGKQYEVKTKGVKPK